MRGLEQRVAVVTGAAGGIGQAICRRFVVEGARLVATDINEQALEDFAEQLRSDGADVLPLAFDISQTEQVDQAISAAHRAFGAINILINNAGWDRPMPFLNTDSTLWGKIIAANLLGSINMHKAVLPHLVAAGGGKIINIASDAGRVGVPGQAVYSACKGGIIAFSKAIARESAADGVCVNVVCPGPTDTPFLRSMVGDGQAGQQAINYLEAAIPLGRLGRAQDLPGIVAFLASEDADFITGQIVSVSGGLTMHG